MACDGINFALFITNLNICPSDLVRASPHSSFAL